MYMAAISAIFFVMTAKMNKFPEIAAQLISKQTICDDSEQVEDLVETIIAGHDCIRVLSFVNAHAVMRSTRNADFFNDLMKSRWLLRDGMGMEMIMKQVGAKPGLNLNGTDFIPRLLHRAPRGWKLALLGTSEPNLGLAVMHLRAMGFKHISTLNGFHVDGAYRDHVRVESPDFVVLAMGMPKQERVARLLASDSETATQSMLIINGGAILDFLSGGVSRAPYWMRRLGVEWLYRLLREPRRMYPRFQDSVAFVLLTKLHTKMLLAYFSKQESVKKT